MRAPCTNVPSLTSLVHASPINGNRTVSEPFVLLQHVLPKRALTELAGRIASLRGGALTQVLIRRFVARYGVDMSQAADPRLESYESFNAFFTRALRADARPLASADWLCPVDGAVSQFGRIDHDRVFQAKGHSYSTRALLGGDAESADAFTGGSFATLYLSPRDYHRIHMPCAGRLTRMVHVPGSLYSVNPATARGIEGLFARNERVVCLFETSRGPMALVLVGATIVGSMATTWHGVVTPPRSGAPRRWDYPPGAVELSKGAEMGRFLLGSTVVMLWPAAPMRFNEAWQPGVAVRMGEPMAQGGVV
jgi:phosphatidylserine decarboxylase